MTRGHPLRGHWKMRRVVSTGAPTDDPYTHHVCTLTCGHVAAGWKWTGQRTRCYQCDGRPFSDDARMQSSPMTVDHDYQAPASDQPRRSSADRPLAVTDGDGAIIATTMLGLPAGRAVWEQEVGARWHGAPHPSVRDRPMTHLHRVVINGREQSVDRFVTYARLVELATGTPADDGYVVTHRLLPTRSGLVQVGRLLPGETLTIVDSMVITVVKSSD